MLGFKKRRISVRLAFHGPAALAGLVAGLVFSGALAGPADPIIYACAHKTTGQLRQSPPNSCGPSESPLQWNVQGPPGPPGPSIAQIVFRDTERSATLAPGEKLIVALGCEATEVVVSGGYIIGSPQSSTFNVVLDAPFFDGTHSGWRVDFLNSGGAAVNAEVRVNASCTAGSGSS